ncbi:MAG: glycosyltransferase, partial [Candidatus Hydrogenedentes bacterium]|nr:glycosyltransferase [Candidatus Hydrogenedentota bacterium]
GQANPFAWFPLYVKAFRETCEVITVGPNPGQETLNSWGKSHLAHMLVPNDIDADLGALQDLNEVLPEGWRPHLVVAISGGGTPMLTRTASLGCPTVYLSIDTWQCLMDYHEAIHYDLVFAAQRAYVPHLRATGSRHVYWLPLACDPDVHYPVEMERPYDISFAGAASSAVHQERARLLTLLSQGFSVLARESVHGGELCRIVSSGRLTFNHSAVQDLNMRIFEALAMGCPLLTNRASEANGMLDLFEEGKHLIVYDSDEDLAGKVRHYLDDEPGREALARQGREEVLARHTYSHRVNEVLSVVRLHFPDFDGEAPAPSVVSDSLGMHLPKLPGAVLDVGMQFESSKYALRRRGATRYVGIARDALLREQRRGSYDEVHAGTPESWYGNADTVILSDLTQWNGLDSALRLAHSALCDGGSLLARIAAGQLQAEGVHLEPPAISTWLRARNFHTTRIHLGSDRHAIVTARKRTRKLRDIVLETLGNLAVPGIDAGSVAAMVDEGM